MRDKYDSDDSIGEVGDPMSEKRFPTRTGLVNVETLLRGSAQIPKVLKQMGFTAMRKGQEPVITNILGCRDTICVLPTSTGKSACFIVPTLCLGWKTIVFSPLVALMRDQVKGAQQKGVKAAQVSGTQTDGENAMALKQWQAGELSLLFAAPERVNNRDFMAALQVVKPDMTVFDECHALSNWSDTFRPAYQHVGDHIPTWNPKVVAAFTATMSKEVESDVRRVLGIKEARKIIHYPRRENLKLSSAGWIDASDLAKRIEDINGSVIVYCSTIKRVEELAQELSNQLRDTQVTIYHGELASNEKRLNQDAFMEDHAKVVVATNAFGMGIDKGNIRAVFHRDLPGTPEAAVQEFGRAGRDGLESYCLAFYDQKSVQTQLNFLDWGYPSKDTIVKVYNFLLGACGPKGACQITGKDIAKQAGVSGFQIDAVMAVLSGSNVIKRVKSDSRVCEVLFTGSSEDVRFLRYKGAIQKGGIGSAHGYKIDQQWLARTLGVSEQTISANLRTWGKEGVITYRPPYNGSTTEVIGKPSLIDFGRLAAKERESRAKLNKVLDYFTTPDEDKHAFLESCFALD